MNPPSLPFRFTVDWTDAGALGAMHYQERVVFRDGDGVYLTERQGPILQVVEGSDALAAILAGLNTAALAQVQDLTAQLAQAKTDAQAAADTAAAALKAAQDDAAAKAARIEELEAQLAAVGTPAPAPAQNAAQQAFSEVYDQLSAGKRALLEPARAAVDALLARGDLADAKSIIETYPPVYPGIEDDRAAFLALFPAAPAPQG